ncbi:unnamed protein product [Effrenium voratum]|nr:unnamed protein product [Effrenium voratum]
MGTSLSLAPTSRGGGGAHGAGADQPRLARGLAPIRGDAATSGCLAGERVRGAPRGGGASGALEAPQPADRRGHGPGPAQGEDVAVQTAGGEQADGHPRQDQDQWRRSAAELEELQENLTKEGGLYEDLKKRVEQEIAKLTDMQQAAYKRLGDLQDAVEKKQDGVQLLREEAESHGTVARNASRAADTVQANLAEARESINKHKALAEEAEQAFFHAKMRVDAAERMVDDSRREVARAGDVRANVLAVRNSLQSFYESMDKLTRSMEANIVAKPGSKPYQLMREDPNTKTAFLGYNNMTTAFRRLYLKSKDLYMFVAGSIPEIEENAEAAIILQCDPDGMLEEEARREGNISSFNARCGPGLWHDLQVERQSFPLDGDAERLDRELADLDMLPVEDEGLDQEEEDEGIPVPDQGQRVGLPAPGMDKIPSLHKMDAINVSDHH